MRNKIPSLVILTLLILASFSMIVSGGSENDPEIRDPMLDVRLFGFFPLPLQNYVKHADIISVWFYEDSNDPDYLFVSLKLRELRKNTDSLEAIYLVNWGHNDNIWEAVIKIHPTGIYGTPQVCRYYGHDDYSDFCIVDCSLNVDDNIITWQIPKDKIGDPKVGDNLIDPFGYSDLRNTEESGKNRADLFKDFTHNARWTKEYTIQY